VKDLERREFPRLFLGLGKKSATECLWQHARIALLEKRNNLNGTKRNEPRESQLTKFFSPKTPKNGEITGNRWFDGGDKLGTQEVSKYNKTSQNRSRIKFYG